MPNINKAYNKGVEICNKANVGYSQAYRNQQTVNGVTYYDCSSFIWYCLLEGGFDCVGKNGGSTWPFTTSTMANVLRKLGFKQVAVSNAWKPGDILIRSGHTEMVYNGRVTMGAHADDRPLQDQVSICDYNSKPSQWAQCWRYGGGASSDTSGDTSEEPSTSIKWGTTRKGYNFVLFNANKRRMRR